MSTDKEVRTPRICPIGTEIFWQNYDANHRIRLEREPNGLLGTRRDNGQFVLEIQVRPDIDGMVTSSPFTLKRGNGTSEIVPLEVARKNAVGVFYSKSVPVKSRQIKKAPFIVNFTLRDENHVMFATVIGSSLKIWAMGISSQRGKFYFAKVLKYEVQMFRFRNSIVIPGLENWKSLPKFVRTLVKDFKSLPRLAEYTPLKEEVPALKKGEAMVKWSDPFANLIGLETTFGEAVAMFKDIENHGTNLTILPKGKRVKVRAVMPTPSYAPTGFERIAVGVRI